MKLATLCYIKDNGKTLMLHRVKKENDGHKNKWVGLGGKVEPGESPEECVVREVEEECGLILKTVALKGIITFVNSEVDSWYVFVYTSDDFVGEQTESDEGDLKWVEDEKLLDLNMWEGDPLFLNWLKRDGIFSAKFTYDEGKLVDHKVSWHL